MKKRPKSGPSGKNLVPRRTVCFTDAAWELFGRTAEANGTNRSAVLNALAEEYCRRHQIRTA